MLRAKGLAPNQPSTVLVLQTGPRAKESSVREVAGNRGTLGNRSSAGNNLITGLQLTGSKGD